jgi:ligand-binding SRPBCC domain-containing protein
MGSFRNVVIIDRPVPVVFAFLSDFQNVPKWNYAITETRQSSPGPVAVGTVFVQRRHIPKPSEEQFTVTEFAPNQRVVIEGTLGPFPARLSYEFEPSDGGTVVTNTVELQVSGPLRLIGGIATSRVKNAVAENLSVLKQLLEAAM